MIEQMRQAAQDQPPEAKEAMMLLVNYSLGRVRYRQIHETFPRTQMSQAFQQIVKLAEEFMAGLDTPEEMATALEYIKDVVGESACGAPQQLLLLDAECVQWTP